MMGLTTVISLLQPPPEVYNLFDDVLLLTDGYVECSSLLRCQGVVLCLAVQFLPNIADLCAGPR